MTLMNENYQHPAMPEGAEEGIVKGMYLLQDGGEATGPARPTARFRNDTAGSHRAARLFEEDWA